MVLIKERISKMLEYIKEQIYPESMPIQKYRMIKTDKRFENIADLDTSGWENLQIRKCGVDTENITGLKLS